MEKLEETQVCTSVEQSERLLKLGLKKETADMVYVTDNNVEKKYRYHRIKVGCYIPAVDDGLYYIPAWSLHRLMEMLPDSVLAGSEECFLWIRKDEILYWPWAEGEYALDCLIKCNKDNMFDNVIDIIEYLVNEGYFNKDYLEEK